MQKMSSTDEQRIMRSLLSVVDKTRAGADPTKVMVKMASDHGYSPQIISRMCEAYNKAKSVHMLQKTSADNRAESFPIVDASDVITKVFGQPIEKAAAVFKAVPNLLTIDFSTRLNVRMQKIAEDRFAGPNPLEKIAGEDEPGKRDGTGPFKGSAQSGEGVKAQSGEECPKKKEKEEENYDLVYDRLKKKEIREKGELDKQASDVRQERIRIERTVSSLADSLRPYSNKQLKKVAQQVYNKYNKKGDQLLSVLYSKLNKEKPVFEKTAKTVIFPLAEPYVSVVRAMDGYKQYSDLTHAQKKIEKQANLTTLLGAAGLPSLNEAALGYARRDPLDDKGGDNILGPKLQNRLKRLDAIDAFYDTYTSDEYLRDQPAEEVMKAFNTVTSLMPSLMNDDSRKAYIGPMVKKLISEGNRVDPLELSRMSSMETDMAKSDKVKAETVAANAPAPKEAAPAVGEQSVMDAVDKSKNKVKTKTTIFTDIASKGSGFIKAVANVAAKGSEGMGTMYKAHLDDKASAKAERDAAQTKKESTYKLEDKYDSLSDTDKVRLTDAGLLNRDGSFPTKDVGRMTEINKFIKGEPYDTKKHPDLETPGADPGVDTQEPVTIMKNVTNPKQLTGGGPIITPPPEGNQKAWGFKGSMYDESPIIDVEASEVKTKHKKKKESPKKESPKKESPKKESQKSTPPVNTGQKSSGRSEKTPSTDTLALRVAHQKKKQQREEQNYWRIGDGPRAQDQKIHPDIKQRTTGTLGEDVTFVSGEPDSLAPRVRGAYDKNGNLVDNTGSVFFDGTKGKKEINSLQDL